MQKNLVVALVVGIAIIVPTATYAAEAGFSGIGTNRYAGSITYNTGGTIADQVHKIVKDSDGNVFLIGDQATNGRDILLQKYDTDGELITSWGTNGTVTYNSGGTTIDRAFAAVVDDEDRLFIAGQQGDDMVIQRYTANGVLDTSWASGGTILYDSDNANDVARDIALNDDNELFVVGDIGNNGGDWIILKFDVSGNLSGDWDTVQYNSGTTQVDSAYAIDINAEGEVFVGGVIDTSGAYNWMIRKYTSTSSLATDWGTMGTTTLDWGGSDELTDLILDDSNNLFVVGSSNADWAIAKYNASGVLSGSFGVSGMLTVDVDGETDRATAVALDSARLYVAGSTGDDATIGKFSKNSGSLNTGWGTDGYTVYNAMQANSVRSLLIDESDEHEGVYIAGQQSANGGDILAIKYTLGNGRVDMGWGNTPYPGFPQGFIVGNMITIPAESSPESISVYSHREEGDIRLSLYDSIGARLWYSESVSNTKPGGWITIPISEGTPTSLANLSGAYYITVQADTTEPVLSFSRKTGGGIIDTTPDVNAPSSLDSSDVTNAIWSIYLTYTIPATQEDNERNSGGNRRSEISIPTIPETSLQALQQKIITLLQQLLQLLQQTR